MAVTAEELRADGFQRAGTVFPDPFRVCRVKVDWDVRGLVVYLMVVNGELKKGRHDRM